MNSHMPMRILRIAKRVHKMMKKKVICLVENAFLEPFPTFEVVSIKQHDTGKDVIGVLRITSGFFFLIQNENHDNGYTLR